MIIKKKLVIVSTICVLAFLTACKTTDYQQTVGEGAAVGCAAGALLGNIAGGDSTSTAIGCALLGLAGTAYGHHVAFQKEQYQSTEQHFEAVIENAQASAADAREYNASLQRKMLDIESEQRDLHAAKKNAFMMQLALIKQENKKSALIKETKKEIALLDDEILIQRKFLEENEKEVGIQLVDASQQSISSLEAENESLKIALQELEAMDLRRAY